MGVTIWHDLECGDYTADQALWRELAGAADGPVLDVGAGTGRVALSLARAGAQVVALDADAELLLTLRERAAREGLEVETVCADARDFALDAQVATVLVPMQTLQLLGGPDGRAAFLRCAHAALRPGGLLAAALADALDGFDSDDPDMLPPLPDMRQAEDGTVHSSRVVAVRAEERGARIVRIRETVDPRGHRTAEGDEIVLDRVDAAGVAREAEALGLFRAGEHRRIEQTDEHVGSEVVVLWRS